MQTLAKVVSGQWQLTLHQNGPDFGLQADFLSARLVHEALVHEQELQGVPHQQNRRQPDEETNQAARDRLPTNRRPKKKEIAVECESTFKANTHSGMKCRKKLTKS